AVNFKRLWSIYEENRDLILMGAYREGSDPLLDEAIRRYPDMLEFLKQGQKERIEFQNSVAALQGMFG
ncbi:MAG: flagellum-specific ATP synthase FliI, partial [Sphingomonadaceae bacterium]